MLEFSPEAIALIVAGIIALFLEVLPGLSGWWDGVGSQWKPLITLGLSLIVPVGMVLASCLGVDLGYGELCPDPASAQLWVDAVILGLAAWGTNQGTFLIAGDRLGSRLKAKRLAAQAKG